MVSEQGERRGPGDEPYQGTAGRTRAETVQVWLPDGRVTALPVYVGIDAAADPALAALARAGTLHQVAEGVALAVPFVFHDPKARLFVLVVPEGLRHRALALRAELLATLAADTEHAVPGYARDPEMVVGAQGLVRRIDEGAQRDEAGDTSVTWLAARAHALSERERELARRERVLKAREQALRAASPGPAVDDTELEEIDDDSALAYERALVEAELEPTGEPGHDEFELVGSETSQEGDDGSEAEDADDQVEEVEDIEAESVDSADAGEDDDGELDEMSLAGDHAVAAVLIPEDGFEEDTLAAVETISSVPEVFAADPQMQLFMSASAGQVWLFVRGRPPVMREGAELELLLQVDPAADVLVPLVTLVFDTTGSPEVRRGVVDPIDPEQREAMRALGRKFAVQLVSWSPDGTLDHWATVHAPRETNARAIVSLLEERPELSPGRFRGAAERLLAAPPPWRDLTHPFQPQDTSETPLTATEAAVLLDELAEWLQPERRDRLRLSLCVSDELIDDRSLQSLTYALDWGLALSPLLAERALALGIADDEPGLLRRRIAGLARASRETDHGGLESGVLHALWAEALDQAARLGVALSDPEREAAKLHGGERAQAHVDALAPSHDPSLDPQREQARVSQPDLEALRELVLRGGYRDLIDACRASERLGPEAAAQLFSLVARRGDSVASDALLSLLTLAEPLRVRAGAALALAERRAVAAIDELSLRVAHEADSDWPLFAVALGRYGAGSFRAIARALTEHAVPAERAELVLAHLALHGARSQLRAKTRVEDAREAQTAARALTLASELKDGKKPVSGLERQAALTVFSELFDRGPRDAV